MLNRQGKVAQIFGVIGIVLLVINIIGLFIPLRAPIIDKDYADFARPYTLGYSHAIQKLDSLSNVKDEAMLVEVTKIFHYGMAHISPEDVKQDGLAYYRMRVPIWENYLLYLLSFIKPDTYQDYEFCSYRKALERGTGRCGQQALALVGFLAEQGLDTGFVHLGGHTIATAKLADDDGWFMLDPDFGGVIPHSLKTVEETPDMVLNYYWNDALYNRNGHLLFEAEGNYIDYGGPEVRWKRVCSIERVAYILKWAFPVVFILGWGICCFIWRKTTRECDTKL